MCDSELNGTTQSQTRGEDVAKRVEVGALEVEYDDVGMGERPFVMVHGFMGSRDDFADVLQPFGELGRTLVPDLRGHGGTTNPGVGYSLDQLTTDLAGFLDATGAGRRDLLGHSVGGLIALRLVLDQPERLASLVLMDTGACFEAPKSRWFARFFIRDAHHSPQIESREAWQAAVLAHLDRARA